MMSLFDGTKRASWEPLHVKILHVDHRRRKLKHSDSPWFLDNAYVFRPRAIAALGDMLREYGELLPLDCADPLSVFNVTRLLPAINGATADIKRSDLDAFTWIGHYGLRHDAIAGSDIFKIADLPVSSIFVTQRFVDLWQTTGLRGLTFPLVKPTFATAAIAGEQGERKTDQSSR